MKHGNTFVLECKGEQKQTKQYLKKCFI